MAKEQTVDEYFQDSMEEIFFGGMRIEEEPEAEKYEEPEQLEETKEEQD